MYSSKPRDNLVCLANVLYSVSDDLLVVSQALWLVVGVAFSIGVITGWVVR